ncbi:hypothetical protein O6H91_11G001600 [Diphasiastrum complanatum]|uniref:Uncharacterized protein n=1 Tax=Diphasiastrum complanatum TaxID=34168 RepID=A0ACC2C5Z6_DIPCM|nr:hypothetical protein O6H91_11G001600 [Diphasiastrum complanatum]
MGFWWVQVGIAVVAAIVSFFIHEQKKRLKLHRIPGPAPLPVIGNLHMLGKRPYRTIYDLQKTYGSIMRLWLGSQPAVVVSSPELIKEVLKDKDLQLAERPRGAVSRYVAYDLQGLSWAPYGEDWIHARKLCMRELLSPTRLRQFQEVRREDMLQYGLQPILDAAAQGTTVDVRTIVKRYLYTDMARMMMHKSKVDAKTVIALEDIGRAVVHLVVAFNLEDYFPIFRPLDLQGYKKTTKKVMKKYDDFVSKIIAEHRDRANGTAVKEDDKDFVDVLLSVPGIKSQPLSESALKNIILDIFASSADSISEAIEWAMCELLRHPEIMKKARVELSMVVGSDRLVEESDIPQLPYIYNIIKETLRFHSGSGLTVRVAREDVQIGGYEVPAGTFIFVAQWAVSRDPRYWERADEFDPDRFVKAPKDVHGISSFEFIPFGSGRRMCVGIHLGVIGTVLGLAQIIHCFEWELPNGEKPEDIDMDEDPGFTLPKLIPLNLLATPRLPPQVFQAYSLNV